MWTTRSLREREQNTVQIAKDRAGERAAPVSEQTLRQARRETASEIGGPLTGEQRQALDRSRHGRASRRRRTSALRVA
jgi:hypothetical protein